MEYPKYSREIVSLSAYGLELKHIKKIAIDKFFLPDGKNGQWESVYSNALPTILIVPITKEGKIVLIKLFRFPVNDWIIELPGGGFSKKDSLFNHAAERELRKKTGYEAESIERIPGNLPPWSCNWLYAGQSNASVDFFIGFDCEKAREPELDPVEKYVGLEVVEKWPLEIISEISDPEGEITYDLSISHALIMLSGKGIINI